MSVVLRALAEDCSYEPIRREPAAEQGISRTTADRGALMSRIDDLIERIKTLEEEVQVEFDKKREDFHFVMDQKRARFSEEVAAVQRVSRVGLVRYLTGASLLSWIVAPVIYAGWVPMLLLDLFLSALPSHLLSRLSHHQGQALGVPRARSGRPSVPERPRALQLLLLRLRERAHGLLQRGRCTHRAVLLSDKACAARQGRPRSISDVLRVWRRRELPAGLERLRDSLAVAGDE